MDGKVSVEGRRVFLSGPMTGIALYNAPEFAKAHARLKGAGALEVYDPAVLWLQERGPEREHAHYMRRCIAALCATRAHVDADGEGHEVPRWDVLVSLDGWRMSAGATLEREVAAAVGMQVCSMADVEGVAVRA